MHDINNNNSPTNLLNLFEKTSTIHSYYTRSSSSGNFSLRSKRFQSSYCAKVRAEAKKWLKGEGEGRRGNACPQTPRFWKNSLDISRFGSFVNWQLVKIDNEQITKFENLLCSLKHAPRYCKTEIKRSVTKKEGWNSKRVLRNFLFFIVKLNFERYMWFYLIWNLIKTSQTNDLSRTIHSCGYECWRGAQLSRSCPVSVPPSFLLFALVPTFTTNSPGNVCASSSSAEVTFIPIFVNQASPEPRFLLRDWKQCAWAVCYPLSCFSFGLFAELTGRRDYLENFQPGSRHHIPANRAGSVVI